ncbi:MAG: fumarate hydratase [Chloroflexi bacterium]|nr:fumarate hydratase [Chloroflexota bacterium]
MSHRSREIPASDVSQTVARLCQEANFFLGEDVLAALRIARDREESPLGRETLEQILRNADIALYGAVQEGVGRGYAEGYLRKSIVSQPFSDRVNTNDNSPAVIHTEIVPGDRLRIVVMPKGGGAENMSRLGMLLPSDGRQGVIDFVVKAVDEAGSNPCPPTIVGVGVGGNPEKAMLLAKEALLRPVGQHNPDPEVKALEEEMLERVNCLGIGPQGFGGRITALAVHVETFPCHRASLPVAVNLQCHSARHKEAVL